MHLYAVGSHVNPLSSLQNPQRNHRAHCHPSGPGLVRLPPASAGARSVGDGTWPAADHDTADCGFPSSSRVAATSCPNVSRHASPAPALSAASCSAVRRPTAGFSCATGRASGRLQSTKRNPISCPIFPAWRPYTSTLRQRPRGVGANGWPVVIFYFVHACCYDRQTILRLADLRRHR